MPVYQVSSPFSGQLYYLVLHIGGMLRAALSNTLQDDHRDDVRPPRRARGRALRGGGGDGLDPGVRSPRRLRSQLRLGPHSVIESYRPFSDLPRPTFCL